ncbi:MAG: NifU family protein [SAR324 cluster bacterium]|nr:NifU family protein [SAR324 cluster bacterium]
MMRIIEKLKDRVGSKKDAATEGPPISPLGGTATDSGDTAGSAPGGSAPGDSGPADLSQPITLQHVWTSEPNAVKLQLSRMILPLGEKRSYASPESALESPLAQSLFELEGVTSVELESVMVQAFMAEDADWDTLMESVPAVIKRHCDSGLAAVEGVDPLKKDKFSFGFRELGDNERTPEEQMKIVQELLDTEINPAVAAHGGYFDLIAVEDNNVYVQLGGGCQGCGMADVTLRQGVEQRMKEVLPEMVALIDTTDHRSGENPYYQPGK